MRGGKSKNLSRRGAWGRGDDWRRPTLRSVNDKAMEALDDHLPQPLIACKHIGIEKTATLPSKNRSALCEGRVKR